MEGVKGAVVAVAIGGGIAAASAALAVCARVQAPPDSIMTIHSLSSDAMISDPAFDNWFRLNLRCSQLTFLRLYKKLRSLVNAGQQAHVAHLFKKKVGVLLYYVGSQCGYREASGIFGLSKSWAIETISALPGALCRSASDIIAWPSSTEAWEEVEANFRSKRGFPGVAEAVDGCLFEKQLPHDFDGFYCRKGYPALNEQAIVDARGRFMSLEVQPGSWSDQKMWNFPAIGKAVRRVLPPETHLIGGSGSPHDTI